MEQCSFEKTYPLINVTQQLCEFDLSIVWVRVNLTHFPLCVDQPDIVYFEFPISMVIKQWGIECLWKIQPKPSYPIWRVPNRLKLLNACFLKCAPSTRSSKKKSEMVKHKSFGGMNFRLNKTNLTSVKLMERCQWWTQSLFVLFKTTFTWVKTIAVWMRNLRIQHPGLFKGQYRLLLY
jgi:hypothetical protein